MSDENQLILNDGEIQKSIYTLRGFQVMLDSELAQIYGVETKNFNRAVKRNSERFPENFRFQLSSEQYQNLRYQIGTSRTAHGEDHLRSQTVTSSQHGGRRYLPYAFTEQGVSMLSAVLRSESTIRKSIMSINSRSVKECLLQEAVS